MHAHPLPSPRRRSTSHPTRQAHTTRALLPAGLPPPPCSAFYQAFGFSNHVIPIVEVQVSPQIQHTRTHALQQWGS